MNKQIKIINKILKKLHLKSKKTKNRAKVHPLLNKDLIPFYIGVGLTVLTMLILAI